MKTIRCLSRLALFGLLCFPDPSRAIEADTVAAAWPATIPPHPRLFFNDANIERLQKRTGHSDSDRLIKIAIAAADQALGRPPLERKMEGRRLLGVSREALERLMLWGFADRMTHDPQYRIRAIKEMEALCAFPDWNPSHFLDVAEMTLALSMGYDTFFQDLSSEQRTRYREAILHLGLEPSFKTRQSWIKGNNNWNQVCHGGMLAGAFATMEDEPQIAKDVVLRAVHGLPYAMKAYAPDGVYPEGPAYWVYGTTYNVIALEMMQTILGTSFDLEKLPGFDASADFYLHVTGPTGQWFNYADCGTRSRVSAAAAWFASTSQKPERWWNESRLLKKNLADGTDFVDRAFPLLILWLPENSSPPPPKALSYAGQGSNPVMLFRSSWEDPEAWFFGIKAGSPSVNHGHMDVGSFVLDAKGENWVCDLGSESYNRIESMGMNLWGRNNGSDRWKLYRYHNRGHNTLMVNGAEQISNASAKILKVLPAPDNVTQLDLGPVYADQLKSCIRTTTMTDHDLTVEDRVQAGDRDAEVRWAMHTRAAVSIRSAAEVAMTLHGKSMRARVLSPGAGAWTVHHLETPENTWDSPNRGVHRVEFSVTVPAGKDAVLRVQFE